MKKRDFIKRLFAIVPGVAIAKNILPNEKKPIKEVDIDHNKKPEYICASGCTYVSIPFHNISG